MSDAEEVTGLVIASDTAAVARVQCAIAAVLEEHQFSSRDCFAVRLAVEEALVNAIRHGNRGDASKEVQVFYWLAEDGLHITIADQGDGFDLATIADPTDSTNLDKPSGRGLLLMRHYLDRVDIEPPGNRVHLLKRKTTAQR